MSCIPCLAASPAAAGRPPDLNTRMGLVASLPAGRQLSASGGVVAKKACKKTEQRLSGKPPTPYHCSCQPAATYAFPAGISCRAMRGMTLTLLGVLV